MEGGGRAGFDSRRLWVLRTFWEVLLPDNGGRERLSVAVTLGERERCGDDSRVVSSEPPRGANDGVEGGEDNGGREDEDEVRVGCGGGDEEVVGGREVEGFRCGVVGVTVDDELGWWGIEGRRAPRGGEIIAPIEMDSEYGSLASNEGDDMEPRDNVGV